jgi:hypothetical protein
MDAGLTRFISDGGLVVALNALAAVILILTSDTMCAGIGEICRIF